MAGCQDALQHTRQVRFDFMVAHPQHPVAIIHQPLAALLVGFRLPGMNPTVHFDHQPAGRTVEIGDERAKRALPAELEAAQLPVAQSLPERCLGRSHL